MAKSIFARRIDARMIEQYRSQILRRRNNRGLGDSSERPMGELRIHGKADRCARMDLSAPEGMKHVADVGSPYSSLQFLSKLNRSISESGQEYGSRHL